MDGHIAEEVYKAKHKELRQRINDITFEAQDNDEANFKFKEALCNIVVLLSKSHDLFGSSHVDEKRKLLGFVFENLQLEGSTLRFSLRKPFELLAQLPDNPVWRAGGDESAYWNIALPIAPNRPTEPKLGTLRTKKYPGV